MIAVVAFVAILPEYVVELHYAFTGHAEYVTANLTGASRLLLGFGGRTARRGLRCCAAAGGVAPIGPLSLASPHRLELAHPRGSRPLDAAAGRRAAS